MSDLLSKLDSGYLSVIEGKFEQKRKIACNRDRQLFGIFDQSLSKDELTALKFLYAYMSLNDLADYDGELFLNHVRETFRILGIVPWGKEIPLDLFLHFILPYRVNNENIEDCRSILFNMLYSRVKGLSMTDAVLEVNHWCHEKVTYLACDPRTSSPLSALRRAIGRCGEESTLAVSALRSLCIPARQCYTPRWAHCDDNHAWVEAWADDRWYYLGACEPDASLNNGWFKDPARRAMLVHTRVPGNYPGPEEITLSHKWYTELNLLKNYAPLGKIRVKVRDTSGNPVPGATVHFQVYNSGEFFSIARLTSDANGEVSLTTGLGDLFIHAACDRGWGYGKAGITENTYYEIAITDSLPVCGTVELDMVPPAKTHEDGADPSEEEIIRNNMRLKEEDRIRAEYESTFLSEAQASEIAHRLALPSERVWKVLRNARGNSHEIAAFLKEEAPQYGEWALKLLESLAEKDLTDTFRPVLKDHLHGAYSFNGKCDEQTYVKYVLCPRVEHEMIAEYRAFFQGEFQQHEQEDFQRYPENLVEWVKNNIQVLEGYTCYQGSATPKGTFALKKADSLSRNIAFVAIARSIGIPARLDPADKRPHFLAGGIWKDAYMDAPETGHDNATCAGIIPALQGRIKLKKEPGYDRKIEYYTDFSLARFEENIFKSMDYEGLDWSSFEDSIEVLPGIYRLITGTRLTDGTVLIRMTVFAVRTGDISEVLLSFRKEESDLPIFGTVPESCTFNFKDGNSVSFPELLPGHSLVAAWIEPDKEPSKHLLRELRELSQEYDSWGGQVLLCICGDKLTSSFTADACKDLPQRTCFGIDEGNWNLDVLTSELPKKPRSDFPLVFVIDRERRIRYISSGYKPGIGAEVIKTLKLLEK